MAKSHVVDWDSTEDGGAVVELGPLEKPPEVAREVCSVCKKSFSPRYIGNHRRAAHGIFGGRTGVIRRLPDETDEELEARVATFKKAVKPKPRTSVEKVEQSFTPEVVRPTRVNHKQPSFKVMPFVVLEDHEGGMWIAERIR